MFNIESSYEQIRNEIFRVDREIYKLTKEGIWEGPNHDLEVVQSIKIRSRVWKRWKCRNCSFNIVSYHHPQDHNYHISCVEVHESKKRIQDFNLIDGVLQE